MMPTLATHTHAKRRRSGTILLELIMVSAMIGVSVLAVYGALNYEQKMPIKAQHIGRASEIASQILENARQTGYDNLTTPATTTVYSSATPINNLPTGATATLTTSWYNTPTNTIKQAVATVTWQENTQNKTVQYTTLVSQYGTAQ